MMHRLILTALIAALTAAPVAAEPTATKPEYPTLTEAQQAKIEQGQVVVYAVKDASNPEIAIATGIVEGPPRAPKSAPAASSIRI